MYIFSLFYVIILALVGILIVRVCRAQYKQGILDSAQYIIDIDRASNGKEHFINPVDYDLESCIETLERALVIYENRRRFSD